VVALAEDKVFMFTGKISVTRARAQRLVMEAGGLFGTSVNSRTDYLVVGERPGSKLQKAESLGTVEIIDEDEFWKLLEEEQEEELEVEEWSNYGIKVISESSFVKLLETLETRVKKSREPKRPRPEELSYNDLKVFNQILEEDTRLLETIDPYPFICPFCSYLNPYSKRGNRKHCFGCHSTYDEDTLKPGHTCSYETWDRIAPDELGEYKICKLCKKVKFFGKEEFDALLELNEKSDYCFSAEFFSDIDKIIERQQLKPQSHQKVLEGRPSEEIEELYQAFLQQETKKAQRRAARLEKRYGAPQGS